FCLCLLWTPAPAPLSCSPPVRSSSSTSSEWRPHCGYCPRGLSPAGPPAWVSPRCWRSTWSSAPTRSGRSRSAWPRSPTTAGVAAPAQPTPETEHTRDPNTRDPTAEPGRRTVHGPTVALLEHRGRVGCWQDAAMATQPDARETSVVFPRTGAGARSSSALGRSVVASALRSVDPIGARAAESETSWRRGYTVHFRRLVEAGLLSPQSAVTIASDGLSALHAQLRFATVNGEITLAEAVRRPVDEP